MKIYYASEFVGEVISNRALTIHQALELLNIKPSDVDPEYDWDCFEMRYGNPPNESIGAWGC